MVLAPSLADYDCLRIDAYSPSPITLVRASTTSLMLRFTPWSPSDACSAGSMPAVLYTLHYRPMNDVISVSTCADAGADCQLEVRRLPLRFWRNSSVPFTKLSSAF